MASSFKTRVIIAALFAPLLFPPFVLNAQELSYDRYAPRLTSPESPSAMKNAALHFLVYPFEILRWPTDKSLVFIEKHYIDKKLKWVYDTLVDEGITPRLNVVSLTGFGGGVDLDFIRMLQQKENFPDLTVKGWFQWTNDVNLETGATIGFERIADTGAHLFETFKYDNRPEEDFYGIGPDTSRGDGTSFRREGFGLETKAGYRWSPALVADLKFGYHHLNVREGEDDGRGQIIPIFSPDSIPGVSGDRWISLGIEADHDTRNRKENSSEGGRERLALSYNEGVGSSDARYLKMEAEASRFFSLGSRRRVLAFHIYGEHNNEADGYDIPFHQMARLGGFGSYPRLSHTLRGFDNNRFFDASTALLNVEYRYTIWEYREFKMDSVLFWDEGQVFGDFTDFQFTDFRESYGLGFRLSLADHVIFALEFAHGDEGTNFYVKSSAPF